MGKMPDRKHHRQDHDGRQTDANKNQGNARIGARTQQGDGKEADEEDCRGAEVVEHHKAGADEERVEDEEQQVLFGNDHVHRRRAGQNEADLDQLRGLEGEAANIDPVLRAVDPRAKNQIGQQQHDAENCRHIADLFRGFQIPQTGAEGQEKRKADAHGDELLVEVIRVCGARDRETHRHQEKGDGLHLIAAAADQLLREEEQPLGQGKDPEGRQDLRPRLDTADQERQNDHCLQQGQQDQGQAGAVALACPSARQGLELCLFL